MSEYGPQNEVSPLDLFRYFFDNSVIEMLVNYSNQYALHNNRSGYITFDEFMCFVVFLVVIIDRRYIHAMN